MPAIAPDDPLALPRIAVEPDSVPRGVLAVTDAIVGLEGEGFRVRRAFAGIDLRYADPFLLLDHLGAVEYAPYEAKGAPDHPHRGFETVTYMLDGKIRHLDSHGGGGVITDGATQWMTAGSGVVHSEMPTEDLVKAGGLFHGVQLWVNLPSSNKWNPAKYQDLESSTLELIASDDAGAVVRVIAGDIGDHAGPGSTFTPITYAHATIAPGARLRAPWRREYNALVYVLAGRGSMGPDGASAPIGEGQLGVFSNEGGHIEIGADRSQDPHVPAVEVLLLGGAPIREQIAWYGPFVMNTREEILQAIEDYNAGRMGSIPPDLSRT